jgi:hypothetical protein
MILHRTRTAACLAFVMAVGCTADNDDAFKPRRVS